MASESDSPMFKSCSTDDHQSVPAKTSSPFRISVSLGASIKIIIPALLSKAVVLRDLMLRRVSVVNLAQGKCSLNLNSFPSNGFAKLALC